MVGVRLLLCCLLVTGYTSLMAQGRKATVYIFIGPECPISQQCTLELGELYKAYGDSISFFGVVPGTLYSRDEVEEFRITYRVSFPIVRDTVYELTRQLKGAITPQAVVTYAGGDIAYSGAIDNSYIALGKKNKQITATYLRDALAAITAGRAVSLKSTKPVGCRIEGIK